jgi:hypothetical protein
MSDPTLQINDLVEVRRIVGAEQAVKVCTTDTYVLKTTYVGIPGAKGDTSSFNDLEIASLADRFLGRLS